MASGPEHYREAERPEEKDTRGSSQPRVGESTPEPAAGWHGARAQNRRLGQLLDAIRTQGGQWGVNRVMGVYQALGLLTLTKATAQNDLAALSTAGHLVLGGGPGRRCYALRRRGAAQ